MISKPATLADAIAVTNAKPEGNGRFRGDCPCDPAHKGQLLMWAGNGGGLMVRCGNGCVFCRITQAIREDRDRQFICGAAE
jgi:hypothetical protein